MIDKKYKEDTLLAHGGRKPDEHFGFVNTPVYRGSTILSNSSKEFRERKSRYTYGSKSNPNTEGLEDCIKKLEGAEGCKITSSGRTAILLSLLSVLSTGDHLILADNVYDPTKQISNNFLTSMGINVSYFDSKDLTELTNMITSKTKAIFFESPGSITFEVIDIEALVKIARKKNIYTIIDNTWGTPLYFKPFDYGIDISIHAGTKYIVGHSDTFIGAVTYNNKAKNLINETYDLFSSSSNADDAYMASRGLRSMKVRMEKQFENTLSICEALYKNNLVKEILYPPFKNSKDHELWKKYFLNGGASLMTIIINNNSDLKSLDNFIDGLCLFGIGASWGGYESLAIPVFPSRKKNNKWDKHINSMVRLHIGLEDKNDLIEDLNNSLANMHL